MERAARIEQARDREEWFSERRTSMAKTKSRAQMRFSLQIASDWHASVETATPHPHPHMMRVMMTSNLAVENRFANGTQGRLMSWYPAKISSKKAVLASHPELIARFVKETALTKPELFPDLVPYK